MSIKEKPLIDAASKLGPLPGFLFANPVISGFFSIVMSSVFAGVAVMFYMSVHGMGTNAGFATSFVLGGFAGAAFGAIVIFGIGVSALFNRQESGVRLAFAFGGVLGLIVSTMILLGLAIYVVPWLAAREPLG